MFENLLVLLAVLLACGALLAVLLATAMALALLRPPRMTDGKAMWVLNRISPAEIGLPFEDVTLAVTDRRTGRLLDLCAWWIPAAHAAGRCMILLHGYADAKIGAIAWGPTLHALGWNVLALDLRAHGHSGGRYATAGFWERHDIAQVIDQLRAGRAEDARQVGLFGISMGAGAAAATAAIRDDLSAVILECPLRDTRLAMLEATHAFGLPGHLLPRLAMRIAEFIAHADFADVSPVRSIEQIRCPLMIIHAAEDIHVASEDAAAIDAAARSRPAPPDSTVCWRVPGAAHLMALPADPERYRARLAEFLDHALVGQASCLSPRLC